MSDALILNNLAVNTAAPHSATSHGRWPPPPKCQPFPRHIDSDQRQDIDD